MLEMSMGLLIGIVAALITLTFFIAVLIGLINVADVSMAAGLVFYKKR